MTFDELKDKANSLPLVPGVYCGLAQVIGHEGVFPAAISIGRSPSFNNERNTVEVHIVHKFDADFYDSSVREECQKRLVEKAPLILRRAMEKVAPFKEPDGSFSYCKGSPASYSQGMPVCIPGLPESDVNANSLARGSRTMTLRALDIPVTPIFDEQDSKLFFELCGEN